MRESSGFVVICRNSESGREGFERKCGVQRRLLGGESAMAGQKDQDRKMREQRDEKEMLSWPKRLSKSVRRLVVEEEGQSTVEYMLIMGIVVMIALRFKSRFTAKVDKMVDNLGNDLDRGIDQASQ
jgi:Flp pilus assembly pilin Flp